MRARKMWKIRFKYVKKFGEISNRQVRELLGVDRNRAFRVLSKLE